METVVVVPGIMGSDLWLDDERLWPPKIGIPMRVENPDLLLDSGVITRDIVRRVVIFGFYDKLLDPLKSWGYTEGTPKPGAKGKIIAFPYNWVKGIPETAKLLSGKLNQLVSEKPGEPIVLLAHSMGGLICAYALECLTEGELGWRDNVRLFVTFGTPFHGAPEALLNAFGVEGVKGISADDCQRLMADQAFPSAYQLFPHLEASANWEIVPPLKVVNDYQSLDGMVELGKENIQAALDLQAKLANLTRNGKTRKFNFCGCEHKTVWAMGQAPNEGDDIVPFKSTAGDGTVPSWSGRQNIQVQFAPLGAKHGTTFDDSKLLNVLKHLLFKDGPPAGPSGEDGLVMSPSPTKRSTQPSVSVTDNAISSLRESVEVEVFSPPATEALNLKWIPVENVETLEELEAHLLTRDQEPLLPDETIALGAQLKYPQRMTLAIPREPGLYALAAWSSIKTETIRGLDVSNMDLVWVFKDSKHKENNNGAPHRKPLVAEDAMELYEKTREENMSALDKIEEKPKVAYRTSSS